MNRRDFVQMILGVSGAVVATKVEAFHKLLFATNAEHSVDWGKAPQKPRLFAPANHGYDTERLAVVSDKVVVQPMFHHARHIPIMAQIQVTEGFDISA